MSVDERSPAERIPIEIIPNILQHLSISDRKNARLVNSRWYLASQILIRQEPQRFIFDGLLHKNLLGLVLVEVESFGYQYLDLEFRNEDFRCSQSEFLAFMKSNALYIHRLALINCAFPFVIIEEIMISCINLKELVFNCTSCSDYEEIPVIPIFEGKLIRENPLSLEITRLERFDWITDDMFAIFCDTYPYMQRIHIANLDDNIRFVANLRDGIGDIIPIFLNKDVLNCFSDEFFNQLIFHPWIQLEELRIRDPYYHYDKSDFEAFLLTQVNLKSLNVKWCENLHVDSLESLFQHIPNLKRLSFSLRYTRDEASINKVIEIVAQSKLEVLHLEFYPCCTPDPHFLKYCRNYHTYYLNLSLRWGYYTLNNNLLTTMLKIFHNLTYLNVSKISIRGSTKEVVTLIFQKQNHLRYLKANDCNWISDSAFKKCHLPKLEYLELNNTRIKHTAFKKFDFPKLKFLRLEGCHRIADKSFAFLPLKCPLLKHLNVKGTQISAETILNVCKNLRFLHCINVTKRNRSVVLDLDTISQLCPSLRFIEMGRFYQMEGFYSSKRRGLGDLYAYNFLEKKWNLCERIQFKCNRCQPSKRQLKNLDF